MTVRSKVLIFGSCVSRDIFNYESSSFLSFVDIYARSSVISVTSSPFEVELDLSRNPSAFQRRMVSYDLDKSFLTRLAEEEYDILLFDFIDARFRVYEYSPDKFITLSNEIIETKSLSPSNEKVYWFESERYKEKFIKSLRYISNYLKENRREAKVVLNKAFWAHVDNTGSQLDQTHYPDHFIERHNAHLRWIYSNFEQCFDSIDVITYPIVKLRTLKNHRWGSSPFHYYDCFYEHAISRLKEIVFGKRKTKKAIFSVDVETLPGRTSCTHLSENLIWGQNSKGLTGLVGILNIFKSMDIIADFYVDPCSIDDFETVCKYIFSNDMNVAIHAHLERSSWGIDNKVTSFSGVALEDQIIQLRKVLEEFDNLGFEYLKIFRAGSLAIDGSTILALNHLGVRFSSNIYSCPFTENKKFNRLPDSFFINESLVDFPVSICLDSLVKLSDFEWRSIIDSCLKDSSRNTHIFMMHNWSLTPRGPDGTHDIDDENYREKYISIIKYISSNFDITNIKDCLTDLTSKRFNLLKDNYTFLKSGRLKVNDSYLANISTLPILKRNVELSDTPYYFSIIVLPKSRNRIFIGTINNPETINVKLKSSITGEFLDLFNKPDLENLTVNVDLSINNGFEIHIFGSEQQQELTVFFELESKDKSLVAVINEITFYSEADTSNLLTPFIPYKDFSDFVPFSYNLKLFDEQPEVTSVNPMSYPIRFNSSQQLYRLTLNGMHEYYFVVSGSRIHFQLQRQSFPLENLKDFVLALLFREFQSVSEIIINNCFTQLSDLAGAESSYSKSTYYLDLPSTEEEYLSKVISNSLRKDQKRLLKKAFAEIPDFRIEVAEREEITIEMLSSVTALVDNRLENKNSGYESPYDEEWMSRNIELYKSSGLIFSCYSGNLLLATSMNLFGKTEIYHIAAGFSRDFSYYELSKSLLVELITYGIRNCYVGISMGGGDFGVKSRLGAVERKLFNNTIKRHGYINDDCDYQNSGTIRSLCVFDPSQMLSVTAKRVEVVQSKYRQKFVESTETKFKYRVSSPVLSASLIAFIKLLNIVDRPLRLLDFSSGLGTVAIAGNLLSFEHVSSVYRNEYEMALAGEIFRMTGRVSCDLILYEHVLENVLSMNLRPNSFFMYNPGGESVVSEFLKIALNFKNLIQEEIYIVYLNDVCRDFLVNKGGRVIHEFIPCTSAWRFQDRSSIIAF